MRLFHRKGSRPAVVSNESATSTAESAYSLSKTSSRQHPNINAVGAMPEITLPKAPDPALDPVAYLRSIYAVRERSRIVYEKAKKNQLKHFNVDMNKFPDTAKYVVSIIKVRRL